MNKLALLIAVTILAGCNKKADKPKEIEVLIADTVNKTLASGHHDRVLHTTYGINRRGRS